MQLIFVILSLSLYSSSSCFSINPVKQQDSNDYYVSGTKYNNTDYKTRDLILDFIKENLRHEDDSEENTEEVVKAYSADNSNIVRKRSNKELALCKNVNCDNIHSNGQVSKTWKMAQLTTCCPSFRKSFYLTNKKNVA